MKILLIFGVLLAVPISRADTIAEKLRSTISKDIRACKAELGLPTAEKELDQDIFNSDDLKYRCIRSCVLTRLGLLVDMKLNMEGFSIFFNELYGQEQAKKKIKAHSDCVKEEKNQLFEDLCDYVHRHIDCANFNFKN